jgi:hypothetical protein
LILDVLIVTGSSYQSHVVGFWIGVGKMLAPFAPLLMWMVDVLGLKLLLALSAFSNGDCLPWCLARSPYTFSPFYARRRFIFLCCVSDLFVTLRADSQLTGRLGIELTRDW